MNNIGGPGGGVFFVLPFLDACMHGGVNQKERAGLYVQILDKRSTTNLVERNDGKDKAVVIVITLKKSIEFEFDVV